MTQPLPQVREVEAVLAAVEQRGPIHAAHLLRRHVRPGADRRVP